MPTEISMIPIANNTPLLFSLMADKFLAAEFGQGAFSFIVYTCVRPVT